MDNIYSIFKNEQLRKTESKPQTIESSYHAFKKEDSIRNKHNNTTVDLPTLANYISEKNNDSKKPMYSFETPKQEEKPSNIFGNITSKFPGFDNIQLPQYDVNFLGSRLSATNLLMRYLVDFFIIIPYFICKNFVEGCIATYDLIRQKEYKKATIFFFLYTFDSLLPLSYIFLFFLMISTSNSVFFNWIANCFILFCVFLLLVIYYSLVSEPFEGWKDLFSLSHLDIMGLGMCKRLYQERLSIMDVSTKKLLQLRYSIHKKLAAKTKDYKEFQKSLKAIFDTLTIDDTYFYYSYFYDDLDKNNTCLKENKFATDILADQMVFLHHKGEHLLFRMNENSLGIEEKEHEFKFSHFLVLIILIFFKIIAPYIFAYEELNEAEIDNFTLFSISLFYIYMMCVLYPLLSHEDLKRRTYILESLNQLILFQRDVKLDEDDFDYKGNSPDINANIDAADHLKNSSIHNIKSELQLKVDITCIVSLETWDNCRRAAVLMDQKRSEKYEIIYIFLGVYFFFVILVLLQVLFDVYLFFSQGSALNSPILVFIFTIDTFIMMTLFFQRIFYGSNFNDTFKKQKDSLEKLTSIFQDLYDLFDIYYDSDIQINNVIYKAIFERILQKYDTVKYKFEGYNKKEDGKVYLKRYLKKLGYNINRIKNQIDYDEKHYHHKFLGIITSDFVTTVAQASIVLVPIIPTLFSSIWGSS